jgi:hypothetical protein
MRRINSSSAALGVSAAALFVALGGTAFAVTQIGTSQIKNGAVTTSKLHDGAVTTGKLHDRAVNRSKLARRAVTTSALADHAVTSAKVAQGTLTASNVAPNTFLPFSGTAANSSELGGLPANQYVQGRGSQVSRRLEIAKGETGVTLLFLGFGSILANCSNAAHPTTSYQSAVDSVNLVDWATNFGSPNGSVVINTTNGLTNGNSYEEPNSSGAPQSVTWQAAYNDGAADHVATAWTTGQDLLGANCLFIGQGITTG